MNRLHLVALLVGLSAGFISACSVYNPVVRDCSLKCSDEGTCPGGTSCVEGFCRPPGFMGACDCNVGDSESCGGGVGECRQGLRICLDTRIWGPCLGEVRPTTELCDGKDNDCDGMIDDSVSQAPACPLTLGVCQFSAKQCVDGGFVDSCGPSSYGSQYEVVEQTCDMVDNDCDGSADQRATVTLLNGVDKWTVVAVQGGYYVFFTEVGFRNIVKAQRFDDFLQPMGMPGTVNTGGSDIDHFTQRISSGGTVAVSFERNDGTSGLVRVTTAMPDPVLLDNPPGGPRPWSMGVTPAGVVRAAYERDAGLLIAAWSTTATTVSTIWRPVRLTASLVESVSMSDDATWVAWDGEYNDGGTSEDVGAVEQVEGAAVVARANISYKTLVTTQGRVQGFDSFSTYFNIPPFAMINESGLSYCPDVTSLNGSCSSINLVADYQQIHSGTSARLNNDMVVGWIDNDNMWVGIALPTVNQIRMRRLDMAGAVVDIDVAGPAGSNFMAAFFTTATQPTSVLGTLLCPP